ncbi:MAG TPA: ATP-binding cassette domain-containing protein [Candidatus Dormibacteraeota bacterium]
MAGAATIPTVDVAVEDGTITSPFAAGPRRVPEQVWAIRSRNLTKAYGHRRAVDGVDLRIPAGSIAGFVGPNGAGKTTTLRLLLGLVRPTEGSAAVLGASIDNPMGYLPRVGALIESPAFYPTLSGRRNLEVLATLGGQPRARIDAVLDIVQLRDRAGDRFAAYSLGMKQRLGVAAALLNEPELLILDEPANGLDPAGIIEMRSLLRTLRDRGLTVFVSSHLLGELEQLADWIVLVQNGKLLFQGPIDELLMRRRAALVVGAEHPGDADVIAAIARRDGHTVEVVDGRARINTDRAYAAQLNRAAMGAGVTLTEIALERATLEDTFLTMTGGH